MAQSKINGMAISLILFPMLLMLILGVSYANMSASGFVPTTTTTTCTDLNCPQYQAAGCAAAASNCNLTGTTFTFLNPNSPFTNILDGNLLGFVSSLYGSSQESLKFNIQPQLPFNTVQQSTAYCNILPPDQTVVSNPSGAAIGCAFIAIDTYALGCTTSPASSNCVYIDLPSWNATNAGITANMTGYTNTGSTGDPILCPDGSSNDCYWTLELNFTNTNYNSTFTYEGAAYFTGWTLTSGSGVNNNQMLPFIGFIVGSVILIVLALGISFQGSFLASGAGFGVNPQGSRLALTFGVELLLWTFMYSEYGSYLSLLGLGVSTAIYTILAAISFIGIYWQAMSYF